MKVVEYLSSFIVNMRTRTKILILLAIVFLCLGILFSVLASREKKKAYPEEYWVYYMTYKAKLTISEENDNVYLYVRYTDKNNNNKTEKILSSNQNKYDFDDINEFLEDYKEGSGNEKDIEIYIKEKYPDTIYLDKSDVQTQIDMSKVNKPAGIRYVIFTVLNYLCFVLVFVMFLIYIVPVVYNYYKKARDTVKRKIPQWEKDISPES